MSDDAQTPERLEAVQRLRAARKRGKRSLRGAADDLGIDFSSLGRYETNKMRLPADLLIRAEAMWPDARTNSGGSVAANAGEVSVAARVSRAVVMLDHVRRNLEGLVASGALRGTLPDVGPASDEEDADARAAIRAAEQAALPKPRTRPAKRGAA